MTIAQLLTNIMVKKSALDSSLKAYCMDGEDFLDKSKDMRKIAGLGACHCCDYFYPLDNDIILIEETQLSAQKKLLEKSYSSDKSIISNAVADIIDARIRYENCLKVYGSIIILYRLKSMCATVDSMIQEKTYKFFLVVSDYKRAERKSYDRVASRIKGTLLGGLTGVVKEIHVCSPDEFKAKFTALKSQQATSQKTP